MPRNRKPEPPGARAKRQGVLQHRRKMSLVQELIDLYAETLRRQRTHADLLTSRTERIFKSENWAKLPQCDHQFLFGVDHILMQQLWQQVVFSYEHNGQRLRLNTAEYRAVPVRDINTDTGAYVYGGSPHKLFTQPKGTPDAKQASETTDRKDSEALSPSPESNQHEGGPDADQTAATADEGRNGVARPTGKSGG